MTGLLLIQPLVGDGRAPATDLVRTEDEILPWLGRSDLLGPIGLEPAAKLIEWVPLEVMAEEGEILGEAQSEAEFEEGNRVNEEVVEPERPVQPKDGAGEGPGVVVGVVFDSDGNGVPGVIITLPEVSGFQVRTDESGAFSITGLPVTGVTAEFLKSAYLTKVDVFQVKATGITKVRIPLELKPVELAEGEYLLEGEEVIVDIEEEAGPIGVVVDAGPGLAGGGFRRSFSLSLDPVMPLQRWEKFREQMWWVGSSSSFEVLVIAIIIPPSMGGSFLVLRLRVRPYSLISFRLMRSRE